MLAVISYPPITPIHLGPVHLSIHGVFIAVGFIAGAWLATRHLRRAGGDVANYQSVLSWALIGALLGARYLTAPAAILDGAGWAALSPLSGNFSILGGFAGGITVGLWRIRALGMPVSAGMSRHRRAPGMGHSPSVGLRPQSGLRRGTGGQRPRVHGDAGRSGRTCGVYQPVAAYDLIGAVVLMAVLAFPAKMTAMRSGQLFAGVDGLIRAAALHH